MQSSLIACSFLPGRVEVECELGCGNELDIVNLVIVTIRWWQSETLDRSVQIENEFPWPDGIVKLGAC
jgi:hypothetical protein